jgi:antitoxin (DNA-binding transcriptional repressor) of toxin-antitoxin stability system
LRTTTRCPHRALGSLKTRLSEYVPLAAAGEKVLVMDRDRIVAQLGPPPQPAAPAGAMTLEELLADLEQARADR